MIPHFKLLTRLALGFLVSLVVLGGSAWLAYDSVGSLVASQQWVRHSHEALRDVENEVSLAKDVETGVRGYIITSDKTFLQPYENSKRQIRGKNSLLHSLFSNDPRQQSRVDDLSKLIDRKLEISARDIALVASGNRAVAVKQVAAGGGKATMDAIRAKADEIRTEEERLLQERTESLRRTVAAANAAILTAAGFSMLLLSLVYFGLTRAQLQQERLAAALAEVKKLESMRDSLNAMLVHDLRTPLTTMIGPLEMLREGQLGPLDETQAEFIGMCLGSSRRLLGLVNELLDIAKMEAGELKVRRETVKPDLVIGEAMRAISLSQLDGAASLSSDAPENLLLLQADQELLTRVLINLLGNAVKFTPAGGKITLGVRECVPLDVLPARLKPTPSQKSDERFTDPSLLFSVRDTGEGIPADDLDRIFEKFGQVESRQAGHKMSTGLGLTFCKLAVEAHGGLIWVESEPGKGSDFRFTIPLRPEAPTPEETT